MATTTLCGPSPESAAISAFSRVRNFSTPAATIPFQSMLKCPSASLPWSCTSYQNSVNLRRHFCGFWKYQNFLLQRPLRDHGFWGGYVASNVLPKDHVSENIEEPPPLEGKVPEETSPLGSAHFGLPRSKMGALAQIIVLILSRFVHFLPIGRKKTTTTITSSLGVHSISDLSFNSRDIHAMEVGCSEDLQVLDGPNSSVPSLCIAVIGATGELARNKVLPALFALYYSGYLPKNVGIFGYSRKNLTDEDLRSIIAGTLTCRVDHEEGCENKTDAFLNQTYHINGGFDNKAGMAKLNARMQQIEGQSEANRIFYLSVPQEALLDVASSLAEKAQTRRGWNRIIIEKPFGFDLLSSFRLTQALLSKFEEKQIYRIDHLLGRNIIENLTVLRFSNLVFEPLWSRTYIRNVQVILSEEMGMESRGRYFDVPNGYGIIRDIVHSHILQTIALFAMEPPVSLDGEDIRNEKVKVLRSIRKLELDDIVLGQHKSSGEDKADVYLNTLTPTFFAAALYIDNARWDGVPFLIKAGMGLIKHRVEIRIQFRHVPGNLYRERIGQNIDLATNELILRDAPDEAILVKVNNKVPGLGIQLDASELNLLYKDKYDIEVPDSYEHLLLDVIDGDSHLFMRSDELASAWNILTPVLDEIDQKRLLPELYEFGGRGPVGAYYLGAKHGVRWADE